MVSGDMPSVMTRKLPIAALGCCRMGLAEQKTQAHVHQVWLDYGPSADDVRVANADVRVCLSDMGVEFGICDVRDIIDECVGSSDSSVKSAQTACGVSSDSSPGFLYPRAFAIPGMQHIIDAALQYGVDGASMVDRVAGASKGCRSVAAACPEAPCFDFSGARSRWRCQVGDAADTVAEDFRECLCCVEVEDIGERREGPGANT